MNIHFNLDIFIKTFVTRRQESLFQGDLNKYHEELSEKIQGKAALVIGGAGTIGSSFIKALLKYRPSSLIVADTSENGLTELTRDLRSDVGIVVPEEYTTYPVSYADPVFEKIFWEKGPFDIVANFAAHKHVRSEKDHFSVSALLKNNVINAWGLLSLLRQSPPEHFFCVSTDKAANPVNVMGASKKIMEELIMAYSREFPVTTARFANVAFSNGSLPDGFISRLMKQQPIAAPKDVKRYFVSPEESGQICLLACILGKSRDIFFPRLQEGQMKTFSEIATAFLKAQGLEPLICRSEQEAKEKAAQRNPQDKGYPVYYFDTDTSGEKAFEEFYTENEIIDLKTFSSLGVIKNAPRKTVEEISDMISELKQTLSEPHLTKNLIVKTLQKYLPNFAHIETGKGLDQKM